MSDSPAPLTNARKKQLRAIGHDLKPVVTIASKGLSENVMGELNRALDDHELIKIKIAAGDRELKKEVIQEVCQQTGAALIQSLGNTALLLREAKQPKAALSNIR